MSQAQSSASSQPAGCGYAILTDPQQELQGFYKVLKTTDIQALVKTLNLGRADRDWKIIKFWPCSDIKKLEGIIKTGEVLKKRLYNALSPDWIKVDKDGLVKLQKTIEALAAVANDDNE
jgi:hypothetical protein